MKLLYLGKYDNLGASSRIRFIQFLPYLKANGISVTHSPLFSNAYLEKRYSKNAGYRTAAIESYARRIASLLTLRASDYDALWIEKELFPYMPAFMEGLLQKGVPYIVDYDDAIFHNYDMHRSFIVRSLFSGKIDKIMRNAAVVVAGNDYLAERARKAGARRVEYVPSVVDLTKYAPAGMRDKEVFTIGWIGTPATSKYLKEVEKALADFHKKRSSELVIIGDESRFLEGIPVRHRKWSEATEVSDIRSFDAGIMPLPDKPWERGKCGYKLIQYMACGVPVVASPVGVNNRIVDHGVNGFLAGAVEEWTSAFLTLSSDRLSREKMGAAARKKVESEYSLQAVLPRILSILKNI